MGNHSHSQNYDREELQEINEALDFWKQFEHDGWLVTGFTGKISAVFTTHGSWDGNGSPVEPVSVQIGIDQVNFFKRAISAQNRGDCMIG